MSASVWLAMSTTTADGSREGVPLTNLDQALFHGAGATKRDLVEASTLSGIASSPSSRDRWHEFFR